MRRVLLVGPLLKTGGVSRYVRDLLDAQIGYKIGLFNTARPPKPRTSKGAVGYQTLFAAGVLWAIRNALITSWNITRFPFVVLWSRVTMVHVTTSSHWSFWESSIYLLSSKLLARKVLFHYLGDFERFYNPASMFEKGVIRWVLKAADTVLVLSDNVRQIILPFVNGRKIVLVPSSVDLSMAYEEDERDINPTGRILVLFMGGNYGVRKGVNDLIAAIPRVMEQRGNVEFLLCGGGDVEQAYSNLDNGFRNNVTYLGIVEDALKSRLLSTASIYVLPSYSEGMPYGIIEAMASGLPIVATKIGCIPQAVSDGENGLLITPGDVGALASSILNLARDHNLMRRMAKANREKARKFFSLSRALDTIRMTYDTVLGVRL